jgi:prepilin-type N-terminal cleavage/methylation domain-containing protein
MKTNQKGFTLIEAAIVVAILGVITAFIAPRFMEQADRPKAMNMMKLADTARSALESYKRYCGTPKEIAGNTLPANGKSIEDAIFGGDSNIDPQFLSPLSTCADRAGIKPMADLAKKTATGYSSESYPVTLTDVTGGYTGAVFTGVAESLLKELLATQNDADSLNAAGDQTGNRIRYSAPNGKKYTVTVLAK